MFREPFAERGPRHLRQVVGLFGYSLPYPKAGRREARIRKDMKLILILLAGFSTLPATAHELPDTGQTLCYNGTGSIITCPAPGVALAQDGSYNPAASQPSYTDNGNGTTTDNQTGLMWVKAGNSAGCNNGVALTWEAALNFCEGLTYAGYSDWRLPNRRELMSIVDYTRISPTINTTFFPNTQSNWYWTSTTYKATTSFAWNVFFYDGTVSGGGDYKTGTSYVRCVRAGP